MSSMKPATHGVFLRSHSAEISSKLLFTIKYDKVEGETLKLGTVSGDKLEAD